MHVLFIPSWYPATPGDMAGCFFREQALALQDHGMRVGVITPVFRSLTRWQALVQGGYGLQSENDSGIETLRFHGVRVFSWNNTLNMKFWERTGLCAFDEYQHRHGRPDVLHVHAMIFGLAWAAAIHRVHGIPFIVTEHSSEFERTTVKGGALSYLAKEAAGASRTFGVSSSLCNVLQKQVPLPAGRYWEAMPNMVSSRFGAEPCRKPLGDDCVRPLVLLSVAGLELNKGHHHLLNAVRQAADAGESFELRICGGGPQESALKELTVELGLQDRVTFLGYCSREVVIGEMAAANALVVASSIETFGVVVIEALMSGKPVLSTRCGGPEDIVIDGRDGILVEKDDPAALAAGLLRLERELGCFDSQDLRRRCIERFSEAAFARRYANVYREVALCALPAKATP
ncbi:glycosyltransferase [Pseudomonas sp. LS44]|uniref:glycosyltransferase n=1 Tax=Pseudomonas sp. LS44 TaxID=1357074 RepID=UPI00215A4ED6|nr:glycosyltransferase [Pseudomonas sp. LS44]UVE19035.1 glycosyltransferase [Pseudomonas sp. LS44]